MVKRRAKRYHSDGHPDGVFANISHNLVVLPIACFDRTIAHVVESADRRLTAILAAVDAQPQLGLATGAALRGPDGRTEPNALPAIRGRFEALVQHSEPARIPHAGRVQACGLLAVQWLHRIEAERGSSCRQAAWVRPPHGLPLSTFFERPVLEKRAFLGRRAQPTGLDEEHPRDDEGTNDPTVGRHGQGLRGRWRLVNDGVHKGPSTPDHRNPVLGSG
ncbi:MAG: hypothetical protein ACI8WY_003544 [Planctomycetota bacterium]|jgi:hypothetical protein